MKRELLKPDIEKVRTKHTVYNKVPIGINSIGAILIDLKHYKARKADCHAETCFHLCIWPRGYQFLLKIL